MVNGPSSPRQRTCTVSIRARPDLPYYSHTTMGNSLFEVVADAMKFFESNFWKGPKPRRDTVFLVQLVADERRFYVRAAKVREWQKEQACRRGETEAAAPRTEDREALWLAGMLRLFRSLGTV
jgi:hypothetical protein